MSNKDMSLFVSYIGVGIIIGFVIPIPKSTPKPQPKQPLITIVTVDNCSYITYKDSIIHRADCTNHNPNIFKLESTK